MSEEDLRKWYGIFSEAWRYLKDHSHYDVKKDLNITDGIDTVKKYTGFEREIIKDLIITANRVIGEQYRRDCGDDYETY